MFGPVSKTLLLLVLGRRACRKCTCTLAFKIFLLLSIFCTFQREPSNTAEDLPLAEVRAIKPFSLKATTAVLSTLHQTLRKLCCISMLTAIIAGLQSVFSSQPGPKPRLHATSIRNFVRAQNYSGLYSLMLGHIPITLFNSLKVILKIKRDTWVARLIASLYTFHKSIWTARYLKAHESDTTVSISSVTCQ